MARSFKRALAILGVVALVATGCSDDSDSSSDDGDDGGDAPELTGEPIRLMVITTVELPPGATGLPSDESVTGAEAAAEAINDAGGVNGSPIEIIGCDERQDPNLTAECGRQAVDENVTAVVGAFTTNDVQYLPNIAEAGIPSVANFPIGFEDFTNEYSFPIQGGSPMILAGQGAILVDEADASDLEAVYLEIAAGEVAVDFADLGLEPRGQEVAGRTPFPPDVADAAPILASAQSSDPGGILLALTLDDTTAFLQAYAQAGADVPLALSASSVTNDSIEELGGSSGPAEGQYVVSPFRPITSDNDTVAEFAEQMDAVDEDAPKNDVSMNSWAGVRLIAQVAEGIAGPVDGPALFEALNQTGEVDLGVLAPFNLQEPVEGLLGGTITRIFNPEILYLQVEDAEIRALTGEFLDPTQAPGA